MQGEYLTSTDILLEVFPMSAILDFNITNITNIDFLLVYYESSDSYLLNKDKTKNISDKICSWGRIFFSNSYIKSVFFYEMNYCNMKVHASIFEKYLEIFENIKLN